MRVIAYAAAFLAPGATATPTNDRCPYHSIGNPAHGMEEYSSPSDKSEYHEYLQNLDVQKLYGVLEKLMVDSQDCWPADGPQDGDTASYAGLFGRLAWHCSGTLRIIGDETVGGCEGGRQRHWPEREWRDNDNLANARALLGAVKKMPEYQKLSWGDLMTFAGTVGLKVSGGPANKFCFGRIDDEDGLKSIMLGSEGVQTCDIGDSCISHAPCENSFHWPEQDPNDDPRCNVTQADARTQGSHSVGLIYVYPHGPQLRQDHPEFDASQVHQRSRKRSAEEVRDTFKDRMGWTDQETVALIGGGHTLGRTHGNCATARESFGEDAVCKGKFTSTAGYEGAWTRTPSKWNYDFFEALLSEDWIPAKSPDGADQWKTSRENSKFASTMRLTSDLSLLEDTKYKKWVEKYNRDHDLFDQHFAKAWFKLTHRSENHPQDDDLEIDAKKCTSFEFVSSSRSALLV